MRKLIKTALLLGAAAFAQTPTTAQTVRAYENAAANAMDAKDYFSALQYLGKVLEAEPNRPDLSYKYADAARLFGALEDAEKQLKNTLKTDLKGEFVEAKFMLAEVKKSTGRYDEAIALYQDYRNDKKATKNQKDAADREIERCEWAMEQLTTADKHTTVTLMPKPFNSENSDFGLHRKGDTLFYSSFVLEDWGDRHYPPRPIVRVFQTRENKPLIERAPLNDGELHTAHPVYSADGKVMVFNKCHYSGKTSVDCALYFAHFSARNGWSEPVALPETINQADYTATQPSIRKKDDGYYELYYASNCPGGKGGMDLWKVQFSQTGVFDKPENLLALNTPADDMTPAFDAASNTLYFSTLGRMTFGGHDVYKAEWRQNSWAEPLNLGAPINSSYDDLYYLPNDEASAYLTSNRSGSTPIDGTTCCFDLYEVKFMPLQLTALAFSESDSTALNGVHFQLDKVSEGQNKPEKAYAADTNEADFDVSRQARYRIIAKKQHHQPDTVFVETSPLPADRKFLEKLYLNPEFSLLVKSFHQWTKDPLNAVRFRVFEPNGRLKAEQSSGDGQNEAQMPLVGKRQVWVIAEKPGFVPDTLLLTETELRGLAAGERIQRNLFLAPASMSSYLPITLYFDNDQPDPRTRAETTNQSYDQTLQRYMERRALFVSSYTAKLESSAKAAAEAELGKFFDEEVATGLVQLEHFAQHLPLFLDGGSSIEIMVKGFASPLAKPEYNMALTQRRIASVRNYFRKYNNGVFEAYIRNGQLKVSQLPLGETAAQASVSDDAGNKRLSVFSPEASRERRAEILEVRMFKN
jgi:hypothetical protein